LKQAEEVKRCVEHAFSAFPLSPQSSTHKRGNPSQGCSRHKRPLSMTAVPISSEFPLLNEEIDSLEGHISVCKVQHSYGKKTFDVWLAEKEIERKQAKLAAKAKAEIAKRAAEVKERQAKEALQLWTEQYEVQSQERRSSALHRQEIERSILESESMKAQLRQRMCKEYYRKWLRGKASERESTAQWRPVGQKGNRPLSLSSPQAKHCLTLSSFQVSILPPSSPKRS